MDTFEDPAGIMCPSSAFSSVLRHPFLSLFPSSGYFLFGLFKSSLFLTCRSHCYCFSPTGGDDQTKRPPIEAEQNGGDDSLSGGTIAGITVGVLIGLACLVALFCLLARRFGFHKAAANAAPLAVVTPHVYSEPSVSVLPVSLPPKKPVVDDGVYMTVDNEDGGHTNIAFSNELYGNTCGDDAIIPSKQELDESEVNPDHSDPVYSNTQGAQATLMEAEPVYGNVDMSSGKAKPVPLPRSGPPPQTYENLANASNIRGDGER